MLECRCLTFRSSSYRVLSPDTFDPGWAAKGNQRTFDVLKRKLDLFLDRFREPR